MVCLYLMGLNQSNSQVASELDISSPTAQRMTKALREGIVKKSLTATLANEKPPVIGFIQRVGELVIRMLENVQQKTIGPLFRQFVKPGSLVCTDEYNIYNRLVDWGGRKPSVIQKENMPVMKMEMGFVRFMSIPKRAFGRCSVLG